MFESNKLCKQKEQMILNSDNFQLAKLPPPNGSLPAVVATSGLAQRCECKRK